MKINQKAENDGFAFLGIFQWDAILNRLLHATLLIYYSLWPSVLFGVDTKMWENALISKSMLLCGLVNPCLCGGLVC